MKILQIIPYFFVDWAGGRGGRPVETVYGLSKALVEQGHSVSIYTTNAFNKIEVCRDNTLDLDGIRIHEFDSLTSRGSFPIHLYISPSLIPALRNTMSTFDIIHLHEYPTFQNLLAHHYAMKHGIPYVLQAHGSVAPSSQKGVLKKVFKALCGHRILRDAAKVIAVSPMEVEQYKRMGISEDKIEIVPNGIDITEFQNLPERGKFRRKHGLDNAEKIVLYLGRIHQVKRIELLVRSFAKVAKELRSVKLAIAGPDDGYLPLVKQLIKERQIEEKVLLTGPLYKKEKLEAYIDADVFVNPRPDEIFGIVFLEALACGTPVICTTGCGIANIINGQVGLAVSFNEACLCNAILSLLTDESMRLKFSKHGKWLVRERFTWEKIAKQVEPIYSQCLYNSNRHLKSAP